MLARANGMVLVVALAGCGEPDPSAPTPTSVPPASAAVAPPVQTRPRSPAALASEAEVAALDRAIALDPQGGTRALVRRIAGSVSELTPEQFARLRARVASELSTGEAAELVREGLEFAPEDEGLEAWLRELEEWNEKILRGVDHIDGY